jgi:hypothetical protein
MVMLTGSSVGAKVGAWNITGREEINQRDRASFDADSYRVKAAGAVVKAYDGGAV